MKTTNKTIVFSDLHIPSIEFETVEMELFFDEQLFIRRKGNKYHFTSVREVLSEQRFSLTSYFFYTKESIARVEKEIDDLTPVRQMLKFFNIREKTEMHGAQHGTHSVLMSIPKDFELTKKIFSTEIDDPFCVPIVKRRDIKTVEEKIELYKTTQEFFSQVQHFGWNSPPIRAGVFNNKEVDCLIVTRGEDEKFFPIAKIKSNGKVHFPTRLGFSGIGNKTSLAIFWLIIFNNMIMVEDKNKTLGELLEDEVFRKKLFDDYANLEISINENTDTITRIIFSAWQGRALSLAVVSTSKTRDVIKNLTVGGLKNAVKASKSSSTSTVDIDVPIIEKAAKEKKEALRKWVKLASYGENENEITVSNLKKILLFAEGRAKIDFLQANNINDFDSFDAEATEKSLVSSPGSLIYDTSHIYHDGYTVTILKLLNALGKNYILHEMSFDELSRISLIFLMGNKSSPVSSTKTAVDFYVGLIEQYGHSKADKIFSEIFEKFTSVKIKDSQITSLISILADEIPLEIAFKIADVKFFLKK